MSPHFARTQRERIPLVSLRTLLSDAEIHGCLEITASGAATEADRVIPGDVYVVLDDREDTTAADIELAVERGASGIVTERLREDVPARQVVVRDARSALAKIEHALAGAPSRSLSVVAIVGTGDLTAAARFLRSILEAGRRKPVILDVRTRGSSGAEPASLAGSLGNAIDRGCDLAIVCLSADDLAARSADGLTLDAALFLGADDRDHVRELARVAKCVRPSGTIAITAGKSDLALLPAVNWSVEAKTFGFDPAADLAATIERCDLDGTRLRLSGLDCDRVIELRPLGGSALIAALGAAAIARGLGSTDGAIVAGMEDSRVMQTPITTANRRADRGEAQAGRPMAAIRRSA